MHFDRRYSDAGNSVAQRDTRMGKGPRIDEQGIESACRFLDPVHQVAFGVGLMDGQLYAFGLCQIFQRAVDCIERDAPVHVVLPAAEEVQVGTMEHQDLH